MDLLALVACVGVAYWGLVSLADMALDTLAARRACKHVHTSWSATPEGIRVECDTCHAHVGTWEWKVVAA